MGVGGCVCERERERERERGTIVESKAKKVILSSIARKPVISQFHLFATHN